MKEFLIVVSFLSLLSSNLNAQSVLDDLISEGKQEYKSGQWRESIVQFKKALTLADSLANLDKRIYILQFINGSYKNLGLIDSAIFYNIQYIETAKKIKNDTLLGAAYFNQGLNYKLLSNYENTQKYYTKALKLFNEINVPVMSAQLFNSFGNLERERGNLTGSINYHLEAVKIREALKDPYELSKSYSNLSQTYIDSGMYNTARFYLFNAIELKESVKKSTATAHNLIGYSYLREKQLDSADFYLHKSLLLRKAEGNRSKLLTSYKSIGELNIYLDNYQTAKNYLDSANAIARTYRVYDELLEIIQLQIQLEKNDLPPLEIITKFEELQKLNDSISILENEKHLISLNLEYNIIGYEKTIGNQTDEILIRKAENETLTLRNILLTVGIVTFFTISFIVGYLLIKLRKRKKETELKNQELAKSKELIESLHEELSHRTSNYYEMFHAIFKYDRKHIQDAKMLSLLNNYINRVDAMSQIQRYLLESDVKSSNVQLDLYLSNLLKSIGNALNSEAIPVIIDEEFETISFDYDKALRLGLVMNEVIANAFKHGFIAIKNPSLAVRLYEVTNQVVILTISDNGAGIKDLEALKDSSKGIGLIEMILKNDQGAITFETAPNEGTLVKITIPK